MLLSAVASEAMVAVAVVLEAAVCVGMVLCDVVSEAAALDAVLLGLGF